MIKWRSLLLVLTLVTLFGCEDLTNWINPEPPVPPAPAPPRPELEWLALNDQVLAGFDPAVTEYSATVAPAHLECPLPPNESRRN